MRPALSLVPDSTTPSLDCSNLRTPAGLRAWRNARGLSQTALAAELDVFWTTINRWENGKTPIPRSVELALLWLGREDTQPEVQTTLSAADELLLALARERGFDVDSDASEALRAIRSDVDNAADVDAAVGGNRLAMIRLRKAVGLRAFR
jgi:transcriptional regulator with XRE-family HTH domain